MMKLCILFSIVVLSFGTVPALSQGNYVPPSGMWERQTPTQARFDAAKLKEAIDFAIASESKTPRNLELAHFQTFGREPYGEPIGQFKERGDATGLIIRNGYVVAE